MSDQEHGYVGYEYKTEVVSRQMESLYADSYRSFGWMLEGVEDPQKGIPGRVGMKFKRDRKLRNRAEVTRLQHQFEACIHEITSLENSKTTKASITAFSVGILGCCFMAGSVFALGAGFTLLCAVLAVPGLVGMVLPYFLYKLTFEKCSAKISPLIEQKYDEINDVCERANALIT